MPTVAEQLRLGRESKKLTLQQVADITKMRTDHVRALEDGDYNVFSAPVYIRGFVRTYSTLLKLDVPQLMAALEGELGQTKQFAEPPSLSGPPRGVLDLLMLQLSKVNWRRGVVALAAAVLLLGLLLAYLALRHSRSADPLQNLKPPLYQSAGETLPLPKP